MSQLRFVLTPVARGSFPSIGLSWQLTSTPATPSNCKLEAGDFVMNHICGGRADAPVCWTMEERRERDPFQIVYICVFFKIHIL